MRDILCGYLALTLCVRLSCAASTGYVAASSSVTQTIIIDPSDVEFTQYGSMNAVDGSTGNVALGPGQRTRWACTPLEDFQRDGIAGITEVRIKAHAWASASGPSNEFTVCMIGGTVGCSSVRATGSTSTTSSTSMSTNANQLWSYGWSKSTFLDAHACVRFVNGDGTVTVNLDAILYSIGYIEAACTSLIPSGTGVEVVSCPSSASVGTMCEFGCASGMQEVSGTKTTICTVSSETTATYSPVPTLTCEEISCPEVVVDGTYFPKTVHSSMGTIGSCLRGHSNSGELYVRDCSATGSWSSPVGSPCIIDTCLTNKSSPVPAFAVLAKAPANLDYGALAEFVCLPGYLSPPGSGSHYCDVGGVWNGTDLTCVYFGLLDSLDVTPLEGTPGSLPSAMGGFDTVQVDTGTIAVFFSLIDDSGSPRPSNLDTLFVSARVVDTEMSPSTPLEPRLGPDLYEVNAVPFESTSMSAEITITVPGVYAVAIYSASREFWLHVVEVQVGPFNGLTTDATGTGIGRSTPAGDMHSMTITARDLYGNQRPLGGDGPWIVAFKVDGNTVVTQEDVTDRGDGTYDLSYTLTLAATYEIEITRAGEVVPNVYGQVVVALSSIDMTMTAAWGYEECQLSFEGCSFNFATRDLHGNNLTSAGTDTVEFTYAVNGGATIAGVVEESGTGYRLLRYPTFVTGSADIVLTFNGNPFGAYTATLRPGVANASMTSADGDGMEVSFPDKLNHVRVVARDAFGNIVDEGAAEVTARMLYQGAWIALPITSAGNGTYYTRYTNISNPGTMIMEVYLDGAHVQNSPLSVLVNGRCAPGSYVARQGKCELCKLGTFSTGGLEECLLCPPNSITEAAGQSVTDCICKEGFFARGGNLQACERCLDGATCSGGAAPPRAEVGHFQSGEFFVACPASHACLEGGACAPGYEGYLCGGCSKGYYTFGNECRKCRSGTAGLIFLAALMLFMCCGLVIIANLYDRSGDNRFTTLIIGFNSIQVSALIADMELDLPPVARAILNVFSLLNFNIELTSPECSVDAANFFLLKYYFFMMLPLIIAVMYIIWIGILILRYKFALKKGPSFQAKHPALTTPPKGTVSVLEILKYNGSMVVWSSELGPRGIRHSAIRAFYQILVFVYLPLTSQSLSYFPCSKDLSGNTVMNAAPSIPCYDSNYMKHLASGIIFSLLYCVGIPAFVVGILLYKKRGMDPLKFELRYGFLVSRYVDDLFFWEVAVMLRKFGVVLCLLFFDNDFNLEVALACMVLTIAAAVHQRFVPFRRRIHNNLEYASLISATAVLFFALAFKKMSSVLRDLVICFCLLFILFAIGIAFTMDMRALIRSYQEVEGEFDGDEVGEFEDGATYGKDSAQMTDMDGNHSFTSMPREDQQAGEYDQRMSYTSQETFSRQDSEANLHTVEVFLPSVDAPPPLANSNQSFSGGSDNFQSMARLESVQPAPPPKPALAPKPKPKPRPPPKR